MTNQDETTSDHERPPTQGSGAAYSWLIPILTVFVVVAAVVLGLMLHNERPDPATIPEPPDELPPAETLYNQYCAGCHGADGEGRRGRYPPLVDTRWVLGNTERLILINLYGLRGPIEVRGQSYDDVMPGLGSRLSDEELAEILTYIRNSWGNEAPPITADDVARVRQQYPPPRGLFTAEDLEDIEDADHSTD